MRHRYDPLVDELRRWGIAASGYHAVNDDGPSHGDSVLAKQRELGMRSRLKREDDHRPVGRDGGDRRRFMAARSGVKGMSITPMWAVDPIPSRNDAGPPRDLPRARVDAFVPEELRWVDSALSALHRQGYTIRAQVLRIEFTTSGSHARKVKLLKEQYGGELTIRQYRYELQRGIDFMRGRKTAVA